MRVPMPVKIIALWPVIAIGWPFLILKGTLDLGETSSGDKHVDAFALWPFIAVLWPLLAMVGIIETDLDTPDT